MGHDDLMTAAECDYDPGREQVRGEEQAIAEEEIERRRADVDAVEPPDVLDLRPYSLQTEAAARQFGTVWLEEMRARGHKVSYIPVVYCDLLTEEQRIEVTL